MSAFTTVNSKDFKDKNKKASYGGVGQIPQHKNCVNRRYAFGAGRDVPREFQNRLTKRRINLLAAIFLPRRTPCCLLRFSRWHNARVILTLPLSEMYATVGSAIACDRLRLYGNNSRCDRLRSAICDPRSSAIVCDHMETSLYG